jgi:hypothetical protein
MAEARSTTKRGSRSSGGSSKSGSKSGRAAAAARADDEHVGKWQRMKSARQQRIYAAAAPAATHIVGDLRGWGERRWEPRAAAKVAARRPARHSKGVALAAASCKRGGAGADPQRHRACLLRHLGTRHVAAAAAELEELNARTFLCCARHPAPRRHRHRRRISHTTTPLLTLQGPAARAVAWLHHAKVSAAPGQRRSRVRRRARAAAWQPTSAALRVLAVLP